MKSMFFILPLVLIISGCKDEELPPDPVRPVLTMTIVPQTMATFGPFVGAVEARYQSQLGFQTSGRMVARDVYVGDVVKKGQRLAALDPTVLQFALTRANADVADARAQLAYAVGVEARQRTLVAGGESPQAVLDNAVASRDTAKARLDQALASLRIAKDQLGYADLYASYDGVISAWNAEIGQFVNNGQAIVTEARLDVLEAVVDIPDELIGQVDVGMNFKVSPQADPSIVATGSVREIGPLADSATRTHRVRLTLKDPSNAFRLGTTVNVSAEHPTEPRISVSTEAILSEGGTDAIWVLSKDGHSVRRQAVTIDRQNLDARSHAMVLVRTGLAAGDRIVTAGVHSLKDGETVDGTKEIQIIRTSEPFTARPQR